jgi:hypothetical protein
MAMAAPCDNENPCGCGETCVEGTCQFLACQGKACGPDGCGGFCGECAVGQFCEIDTCRATLPRGCTESATGGCSIKEFQCLPVTDGCTPACAAGTKCAAGVCLADEIGCAPLCNETTEVCHLNVSAACGCEACVVDQDPNCLTAWDLPCVLACQECGTSCTACEADCTGKVCGSDGCGGSCGSCPAGTHQCDAGTCESTCQPSCAGKACGDNGCGGSCGSCGSGTACQSGQCVSTTQIDCLQLYEECFPECNSDQACIEACYNTLSPTGKSETDAFMICLQGAGCYEAADFNACMVQSCFGEFLGCFHGDKTCAQVASCLDGCGSSDQACWGDCLAEGTADVQSGFYSRADQCLVDTCCPDDTAACSTTEGQTCIQEAMDPGGACAWPAIPCS